MILYTITHKRKIINIINLRFKNILKSIPILQRQISKLIYKRNQKIFNITMNYLLE